MPENQSYIIQLDSKGIQKKRTNNKRSVRDERLRHNFVRNQLHKSGGGQLRTWHMTCHLIQKAGTHWTESEGHSLACKLTEAVLITVGSIELKWSQGGGAVVRKKVYFLVIQRMVGVKPMKWCASSFYNAKSHALRTAWYIAEARTGPKPADQNPLRGTGSVL